MPLELYQPKFVSIDTSLLVGWSAAATSTDARVRETAADVWRAFQDSPWIPTVCWHHIEELIGCDDEQLAADRIAFLRGLPQVAWIDADPVAPGSAFDLLVAEIRLFLQATAPTTLGLRTAVRASILRYGAGSELPVFGQWREFRPYLRQRQSRAQRLASLTHGTDPELERVRIGVIRQAHSADESEVAAKYAVRAKLLARRLAQLGDRRLQDPSQMAQESMTEAFQSFLKLKQAPDPLLALLSEFGLSVDDVRETDSVGSVGNVAVRKRQIGVACQRLGISLDVMWPQLKNARPLSLWVKEELQLARGTAPVRANGSDVADSNLAAFAPYLDAVIVDKRTHGYLTQICRRNEEFRQSIGSFERCTSYEDLLPTLAAIDAHQ